MNYSNCFFMSHAYVLQERYSNIIFEIIGKNYFFYFQTMKLINEISEDKFIYLFRK